MIRTVVTRNLFRPSSTLLYHRLNGQVKLSGSHFFQNQQLLVARQQNLLPLRALSSDAGKDKTDKKEEADTKEIVLTPGEKVVVASRLAMWAGIAAFAAVCAFYIGKELIPT